MAKCPHCNELVLRVNLDKVESSALSGGSWNTILYSCPHCQKVLNVQIDPVALKTDIITALQNR
jgi:phage FluMu protein Com